MTTSVRFVLSHDFLNTILSPLKVDIFPMKINIVVTTSSMTLRIPAKVLLHVWSYDFYDMTLSTGKQSEGTCKYSYQKLFICTITGLILIV